MLKAPSAYLDFTITKTPQMKTKEYFINGLPVIQGDYSIDISGMNAIFTWKNIDAKKLREKA